MPIYLGSTDAMDSYEEGTWSPNVRTGSYLTTMSNTVATYKKIGDMVFCELYSTIRYNDSQGANGLYIYSGLPFTPKGTNMAMGVCQIEAGSGIALMYTNTSSTAIAMSSNFPAGDENDLRATRINLQYTV